QKYLRIFFYRPTGLILNSFLYNMQLFYAPQMKDGDYFLTEEESRHCARVLRYQVGQEIHLTDGEGQLAKALLSEVGKTCRFKIIESKIQARLPYHIHIALAPTKQMERTEWFVEKCVELGIQELSFIQCAHSERKHLKAERIRKIAITAMKQSLNLHLPLIHPLQSLEAFLEERPKSDQQFIAYLGEEAKTFLGKLIRPQNTYCIMIGPEGDFSPNEVKLALKHQFMPVSLGDRRYRTETAGLVACHICNLINQ
ncbi:MAG: 16S rRNA (uracil(1498)-N(3))-methyltransferase, partial [Bacteroidota bacterium]